MRLSLGGSMMNRLFVCLVVAAPLAGLARAETVVVTPSQDNTLIEDATGSLSNGAGNYLFAGRSNQSAGLSIRRGLVQFDLAGKVPSGVVITSVRLTMNMSRTNFGAAFVSLHRVGASWGESGSAALGEEGAGAAAEVGDATWLHRSYDTVTWSSAGGDFAPVASASIVVVGIGSYTWGSTPEMIADVEAWLADPSANHGWAVVGDESVSGSSKRFGTHENPDALQRPTLAITYVKPVPAASTWGLVGMCLFLLAGGSAVLAHGTRRSGMNAGA